MKSFLFCSLEHDNTVSKERLKVSNYLLIILLYTCLCTNIYKMFSQHYVSQVRNPFCSPLFSLLKSESHCTLLCSYFSSQKPIIHSSVLTSQVRNPLYTLQRNALPYNLMVRPHLVFMAWLQLVDTVILIKLYNLFFLT